MLFSELYEVMVDKVTFVGFRGGDRAPWIRPWFKWIHKMSYVHIATLQECYDYKQVWERDSSRKF